MDDSIFQVGIGGALAYLLIKLILDFITKTKPQQVEKMDSTKLVNAIEELTKAVQALNLESKLNAQTLRAMARDLQEMRQQKE